MADDLTPEGVGEVAIIGMACRFPQAPSLDAFWDNLRRGVESISTLSEEEVAALPRAIVDDPHFVRAGGCLEGIDLFDSAFFGLSPAEATATDPQQRLFLECGWEALESAGYEVGSRGPAIGVFAGVGESRYLDLLRTDPRRVETLGEMQLAIGNGKDHFTTRLSYLLDLRGPSVPINTACSTSLVAVHVACQSLLHFECDMALAGACSVSVPAKAGYLFEEGGTLSPDGRCRAFDASSRGTAPGSGVGVVVLKRLEEALAAGDPIRAVIRGSAINNDGASKVGYTAPSVAGQRQVIEEALAVAGLEAAAISYVEAHGTGTTLGDPIEVEALRQAFGNGLPHQSCALGSVKTNIGHLDAAAGIAGLIKTVLCLEHHTLVPSLHFEQPNPQLELERSPFYVQTETVPWDRAPRLAGVSSFGIGGTNAHLVVAEAPPAAPSGPARCRQLLTLSAHTTTALSALEANLGHFLAAQPTTALPDMAYTLSRGRKALDVRRAMVCETNDEARQQLADPRDAAVRIDAGVSPTVVFLFPGQGKAYADLGRELYRQEAGFREEVDRCCDLLAPHLEVDLRRCLFAADEAARAQLLSPACWQPALFVVEHALARLLMAWGVVPAAMIGHSLGEVVAATLAGVLELEDALALVAERGRGTAALAPGAMLAVPMSEEALRPYLDDDLALAAVNGPELCAVAGPPTAIERLAAELAPHQPIRLAVQRAFHSSLVQPLMAPLTRLASTFTLRPPSIPYLSNVTGTWMRDEEATDPGYWARHLRETVRFGDGLAAAASKEGRILLEVGPGRVLANLAQRSHPQRISLPTMAAPAKPGAGVEDSTHHALLSALGGMWTRGVSIDWKAFYAGEKRHRLVLPTYPFERKSHWIETQGVPVEGPPVLDRREAAEDWLYAPTFKRAPRGRPVQLEAQLGTAEHWLVFADEGGFAAQLEARLGELGQSVTVVRRGAAFEDRGRGRYALDPAAADGMERLLTTLADGDGLPARIVYAWGLDAVLEASGLSTFLAASFDSLIRLAQRLASLAGAAPVRLGILTAGMQRILDEPLAPGQAVAMGLVHVLPKEMAHIECQSLDVETASGTDRARLVDAVLDELTAEHAEPCVAFRHGRRWLPSIERLPVMPAAAASPWRPDGVYLVTHGLQELGLALAARLVEGCGARLVLVDRSFFPPSAEWDAWVQEQGEDDGVSRKIARLRGLGERLRVVTADPADGARMRALRAEVEADFGTISGLIHLDKASATGLIQGKSATEPSPILRRALQEALVIEELFADLDLLVLCASNAAESGGLGQVEQAAAHAFLDSFAERLADGGRRALTIDWGTRGWTEAAEEVPDSGSFIYQQLATKRRRFGMSQEECLDTLEHILGSTLPRVIVSTRDFGALMEQQHLFTTDYFQTQLATSAEGEEDAAGEGHARPQLSSSFEAPRNEVEALLAEAWRANFGLAEVGVQDNFFELGGHSLLAVQVLKKLNETFSTQLALSDFFNAPTIAALAAMITGGAIEEDQDLDALLAEIEGLSSEEVRSALEVESSP